MREALVWELGSVLGNLCKKETETAWIKIYSIMLGILFPAINTYERTMKFESISSYFSISSRKASLSTTRSYPGSTSAPDLSVAKRECPEKVRSSFSHSNVNEIENVEEFTGSKNSPSGLQESEPGSSNDEIRGSQKVTTHRKCPF